MKPDRFQQNQKENNHRNKKKPEGIRGLAAMILIYLAGLAGMALKNRRKRSEPHQKGEVGKRLDKTRREGIKAAEASYFNRLTLRLAGSGLFYALALAAGVAVLLVVYFLTIGTPPEAILPPRAEPREIEVSTRVALLEDERSDLIEEQIQRLNSYGWIDREAGRVHIPVDRAMQLLSEEVGP
jgi:hypothetical protein